MLNEDFYKRDHRIPDNAKTKAYKSVFLQGNCKNLKALISGIRVCGSDEIDIFIKYIFISSERCGLAI